MSEFEKGFPYDGAPPPNYSGEPQPHPSNCVCADCCAADNSFDLGKAPKNLHDLQKVGEAIGLSAPAPGAERHVLRELLQEVLDCETQQDENGHAYLKVPARSLNDLGARLREALAAAPPALHLPPDERLSKIINDFIDVPATEPTRFNKFFHALERHIEQVAGDRHASAERVRALAQSWSHDTSLKNEGTLDEKRMHTSSTCRRCQLERALPPSTGEKSQ